MNTENRSMLLLVMFQNIVLKNSVGEFFDGSINQGISKAVCRNAGVKSICPMESLWAVASRSTLLSNSHVQAEFNINRPMHRN